MQRSLASILYPCTVQSLPQDMDVGSPSFMPELQSDMAKWFRRKRHIDGFPLRLAGGALLATWALVALVLLPLIAAMLLPQVGPPEGAMAYIDICCHGC
jgi:hypothetical protein